MCNQNAGQFMSHSLTHPLSQPFIQPLTQPLKHPLIPSLTQNMSEHAANLGSRRRRLWDLPHHCHCPVVGVCLPLHILRTQVNKALGGQAMADDYEIHVGAVAECGCKNKLSVALQKVLEQRYATAIMRFKSAKTAREVAQLWTKAIEDGDIAGAFWAALTHPRCDAILQEVVCRDMHMLQHQAGAVVRTDITKLKAVIAENAVLSRELGRVQERITKVLTEKSAEIEKLKTAQMQSLGKIISKDSQISFITADLASFKAGVPELDARTRLQKKAEQLEQRLTEQQALISDLRQQLLMKAEVEAANAVANAHAHQANQRSQTKRVIPIVVQLQQKSILCVGGRVGNVASYRDAVERVGGRFAHHDGGVEDNQHLLDASLAAADMVICQTGCISHNAYWRVKDFCKRTGKQCVFVENPSVSSLTRGLEQLVSSEDQAA
jgi:ribosomal protein S6